MVKKEKILIIDDEPEFVDAFSRTFEARFYIVSTASTREQAQKMMETQPDIVVLGTLAPAGTAFSFHKWLNQNSKYKDIPLMVIDACYKERSVKGWRRFEGIQLESDAYVSKPIEPAALVPQIQFLLAEVAGPKKIRILVVDDHTMIRHGIHALLAVQKDMEVVGEAVNGQDALEQVQRLMPNVALMDIVMPVMSGLEATRKISTEYPQTKVLILTQYDEEENMLVAKQAGAHGFIPKNAASSELVEGIRAINSERYFSRSLV